MNYEDILKLDYQKALESAKLSAIKQSAIKTKKLTEDLGILNELSANAINKNQWKPLLDHFNLLNEYLEQDEQFYIDYCMGKLGYIV